MSAHISSTDPRCRGGHDRVAEREKTVCLLSLPRSLVEELNTFPSCGLSVCIALKAIQSLSTLNC